MGLGDEILAAGHAQAVYDVDQSRKVAICDAHGHVRSHIIWQGNPIIASQRHAREHPVWRITNGTNARPYIKYPFSHDVPAQFSSWRARDHVGRVYLTRADEDVAREQLQKGPYVLIEPSLKDGQTRNKQWGFKRYEAVVAACPDIRFVRIMHTDFRPLPGADNVSGLSLMQALGLVKRARAVVVPEGGLHHAAAAFDVPAVVLFGSRVPVETLGYPDHENLGTGEPCGMYQPCAHCKEVWNRVTVDEVVASLRRAVG